MSTLRKRSAQEAGLDLDQLLNENGGNLKSHTLEGSSRQMQGSGGDGKKHSLDSDEELEEDTGANEKLNDDEIEGQEDFTIEREGEIKITPFNLIEEQEEGHFAKDGNFVWKKEKEVFSVRKQHLFEYHFRENWIFQNGKKDFWFICVNIFCVILQKT